MTPVGSVTLTTPGRGYYFDIFTNQTRTNLETNQRVCILAVNSGLRFWLVSLIRGAFTEIPAVRLYGTVGPSREASDEEIARWQRKVHFARFFKGHKLLWGKLRAARVRDLYFDDVAPVKLGGMTRGLWDSTGSSSGEPDMKFETGSD